MLFPRVTDHSAQIRNDSVAKSNIASGSLPISHFYTQAQPSLWPPRAMVSSPLNLCLLTPNIFSSYNFWQPEHAGRRVLPMAATLHTIHLSHSPACCSRYAAQLPLATSPWTRAGQNTSFPHPVRVPLST